MKKYILLKTTHCKNKTKNNKKWRENSCILYAYSKAFLSVLPSDCMLYAWDACNRLPPIWQSNIPRSTKLAFFRACVESILLYGSETWTMKKALQDRLDGTYTRLLMRVQNISWREYKTKAEIYGDIPPISSVVACRRTRFGFRAKDQIISDVISLRLPCPNRGRRPLNYIDCIARDIGHDII